LEFGATFGSHFIDGSETRERLIWAVKSTAMPTSLHSSPSDTRGSGQFSGSWEDTRVHLDQIGQDVYSIYEVFDQHCSYTTIQATGCRKI
jgi:hypothetical protein